MGVMVNDGLMDNSHMSHESLAILVFPLNCFCQGRWKELFDACQILRQRIFINILRGSFKVLQNNMQLFLRNESFFIEFN
jgi:hypothetical protein